MDRFFPELTVAFRDFFLFWKSTIIKSSMVLIYCNVETFLESVVHPKFVDSFVFWFDLDSMTSQRDPNRKTSLTRASTTKQIVAHIQYEDPKMAGPSLIRHAIFGSAYCKSADFVNKNQNKNVDVFWGGSLIKTQISPRLKS